MAERSLGDMQERYMAAGRTAILMITEGHETAFNGFWYQFTIGKPLKNLKLTLEYYEGVRSFANGMVAAIKSSHFSHTHTHTNIDSNTRLLHTCKKTFVSTLEGGIVAMCGKNFFSTSNTPHHIYLCIGYIYIYIYIYIHTHKP